MPVKQALFYWLDLLGTVLSKYNMAPDPKELSLYGKIE